MKYRRMPYVELRRLVDTRLPTLVIKGASGAEYQVVIQVHWEGKRGGDIRIVGLIDDFGWRAFVPLREDFITGSQRHYFSGLVGIETYCALREPRTTQRLAGHCRAFVYVSTGSEAGTNYVCSSPRRAPYHLLLLYVSGHLETQSDCSIPLFWPHLTKTLAN